MWSVTVAILRNASKLTILLPLPALPKNYAKHPTEDRLSYAHDASSSDDPDMENICGWENELRGTTTFISLETPSPSNLITTDLPLEMAIHVTLEDLEQEKLGAYAKEYAALNDFDNVDGIDWSLSEFEDEEYAVDHDVAMSRPVCFPPALRCIVSGAKWTFALQWIHCHMDFDRFLR